MAHEGFVARTASVGKFGAHAPGQCYTNFSATVSTSDTQGIDGTSGGCRTSRFRQREPAYDLSFA